MFSPQARAPGYLRLGEEAEEEGDSVAGAHESRVRAPVSPFGGKRRTPTGYAKLPQATLFGSATDLQEEDAAVPPQPELSGHSPATASSCRSSGDVERPKGGDSPSRKRPPRLAELSESDHTADEQDRKALCPDELPIAMDDAMRPPCARAISIGPTPNAGELAQQTFELAHEIALRSPMAMRAQNLKQQLESLAENAASRGPSCPASPAQAGAALRNSPLAALAGKLALLEAQQPCGPVPGSPAAAQALKAARSRLAAAAATAQTIIAATTPKGDAADARRRTSKEGAA